MPTDPRHGRSLPSGRRMGRVLSGLLRAMSHHAIASIQRGRTPDFEAYHRVIVQSITPLYLHEYQLGKVQAMRSARRLEKAVSGMRAKSVSLVTKDPLGSMPLVSFDLFREEVPAAVQRLVLALAGSITETTRDGIREALGRGLSEGETVSTIAADLGHYFSPQRAFTIALTESSRSMHQGEVDQFRTTERETGLKFKKVWLASADACDVCEKLNGQKRWPDEAFMVWPTGNQAYRVVQHAPAHPHCFCSLLWEEV